MTVYLVKAYDDIHGAFSSEEKAQAWIEEQKRRRKGTWDVLPSQLYVEPIKVDAPEPLR